jgi:hypothetical protein
MMGLVTPLGGVNAHHVNERKIRPVPDGIAKDSGALRLTA